VADSTLHLLPIDPRTLPSELAESRALAMLRSHFDHVESQRFDAPVFVDAGQSFEAVACPSCDQTLDAAWWGQRMDAAHAAAFADLSVQVPCCGVATSLNDLRYDMPQGFARFTLSVRNPGRKLHPRELRELEALLGTSLRLVRTRL
jgi:hypothetical protein